MTDEDVKTALTSVSSWKRGDERAPHKPLLQLLALSKLQNGGNGDLCFPDIENELASLLRNYGPSRKIHHPEYPFWRMGNDRYCGQQIWELIGAEKCESSKGHPEPKRKELRKHKVIGRFGSAIRTVIHKNPSLIAQLAFDILEENFPKSLHQSIVDQIGLSLSAQPNPHQKRDAAFREKMLSAYGYRCAFCGYDLRLGQTSVGLEAAHIKWHQAGGPCIESNGLALCVMHHHLFDRGVFSLDVKGDSVRSIISSNANGYQGFDEILKRYHGATIDLPDNPTHRPKPEFINWHQQQVFSKPMRYLPNHDGSF